jgi:hypothetical protein
MEVRLLLAAKLAPCQTSWQGSLCRLQTVELQTRLCSVFRSSNPKPEALAGVTIHLTTRLRLRLRVKRPGSGHCPR